MSYQVLARKYRPRRFEEVVGQEPVVRTLTNALESGRIHHAYVFSGIRGVGKTTTARLLAKALNCVRGPTAQPCGECDACREIADGRSLDSIEIDAASNRGIDEIKGLIQNAQYAPSRDRHKVFIIDEFHMLTREAFNALLKTLEEPPRHVIFILATTELEKVPATVLSRCLLLGFRPVAAEQVRDHLLEIAGREGVALEPAAADLIVRKAGGSLRDAQSTLDRVIALAGQTIGRDAVADVLGVVDARVLRALLAAVLDGQAGEALALVDDVVASGADLHAFLDDLTAETRGVLLTGLLPDPGATLGVPEDEVVELAELARRGSPEDVRRALDRLIDAGPRLRQAPEPRFFLEALVVRLAHLTRLEPLVDVLRRLEEGAGSGPPAAPRPGGGTTASGPSVPGAVAPAPAVPRASASAPASTAAAPPVRAAAPPGAAAAPGAPSWRARVAQAAARPAEEPGADVEEPPPLEALGVAPVAAPAAPPVRRRPASRREALEAFRGGLPARLRGLAEHGLLQPHEDGLALLLPAEMDGLLGRLEEQRFHLVAAASEAFGRPVPVHLAVHAALHDLALPADSVEGEELAARRRRRRAEEAHAVRAVVERFDGRVVEVEPRSPGGEAAAARPEDAPASPGGRAAAPGAGA